MKARELVLGEVNTSSELVITGVDVKLALGVSENILVSVVED